METIEKNELFEKINEVVNVLPLGGAFEEKYKDILDKHDAQNIKSNISEKISAIKDPLERVVVACSVLNELVNFDPEDVTEIRTNHDDLFRMIMPLNVMQMPKTTDAEKEGYLVKANDYFEKYITNFK